MSKAKSEEEISTNASTLGKFCHHIYFVWANNKKAKIQSIQLSPYQITRNQERQRGLGNKKDVVWVKREQTKKLFFHQKTLKSQNM